MNNYQTIKEAGYKYIEFSNGIHRLKNTQTNDIELFASSKYHAGWALIYKNTHLEFLRTESALGISLKPKQLRGAK